VHINDRSTISEALATFQQCFDPRKLLQSFNAKNFFGAQDATPSDSEMQAFANATVAMMVRLYACAFAPTRARV
jgi:hypothetical protein